MELRDASGPSVDPSTFGPSLIRNGLHAREKGKRVEKAKVCQKAQDRISVAASLHG